MSQAAASGSGGAVILRAEGAVSGAPFKVLDHLDAIVRHRQDGRRAEYSSFVRDWETSGGCSWMNEWLEDRFGLRAVGGCYEFSSQGHAAHWWSLLPDGRILDVTADQFDRYQGEHRDHERGIRIASGDDPRYNAQCDGEVCFDLPHPSRVGPGG